MPQRLKVLLLIPHMRGGGAERVVELLAKHLNPAKYELHLGLISESFASSNCIPPHVTLHCLGHLRVRVSVVSLLRLVHRIRPDVILSSMAHLNFLVLILRPVFPSKTCVLVRQNGTVSSMLGSSDTSCFTRAGYRFLYPRADRIICQSQSMADDLLAQSRIHRDRVIVLNNPVQHDEAVQPVHDLEKTENGPILLAASRLSHEKGVDLLLDAIALLIPRFPNLRLSIAGTGPEESFLGEQCKRLGIVGSVAFLGFKDSLTEYFRRTDLFVLPSRHEGMPNAILEAADAGLPIAATPACGGIIEMLHGAPGVSLAREVSAPALAEAISNALEMLPRNASIHHEWLRPFRLENAIPAYEALIDSCATRTSNK